VVGFTGFEYFKLTE